MSDSRTRVLLACCGLDHARRGFESFARECFEALRGEPELDLTLAKGSGPPGAGERAIPTLRRDRAFARAVGRILGARPFRIEALAFAFTLQPLLASFRPDVVYLSEWDTARGLAALRSATRHRFKLLLCNGGFADRDFGHLDHVQQLTPGALDYVVARGADPRRHSVLPLGFWIAPRLSTLSSDEREALRARLGLPSRRSIVVSVAALNRHHKRLDYLIEEVARLPEPRPFLLLVGEPEEETRSLRTLAHELLGEAGHAVRTVALAQVRDLLRVSDVFVLASTVEAQGRSLIEAMGEGLPCVAHDSSVTRFALGDHGFLGDLTKPGTLARMLQAEHHRNPQAAAARHRFVYERFSWDRLRPRYVEVLQSLASSGGHQTASVVANSTVSSSTGDELFRYRR